MDDPDVATTPSVPVRLTRSFPLGLALTVVVGVVVTVIWAAAHSGDSIAAAIKFGVLEVGPGLPLFWCIAWIALYAPRAPRRTRKLVELRRANTENVESSWMQRASSRAFVDVILAVGITQAVVVLGQFRPDARLLLGSILAFALLDQFVRYQLIKRNEAS